MAKKYKIQWGDTLWDIAQATGKTVKELKAMQGEGFKMIAGKTLNVDDDFDEDKVSKYYEDRKIDRPNRWKKKKKSGNTALSETKITLDDDESKQADSPTNSDTEAATKNNDNESREPQRGNDGNIKKVDIPSNTSSTNNTKQNNSTATKKESTPIDSSNYADYKKAVANSKELPLVKDPNWSVAPISRSDQTVRGRFKKKKEEERRKKQEAEKEKQKKKEETRRKNKEANEAWSGFPYYTQRDEDAEIPVRTTKAQDRKKKKKSLEKAVNDNYSTDYSSLGLVYR